jgi:hypothetical protein
LKPVRKEPVNQILEERPSLLFEVEGGLNADSPAKRALRVTSFMEKVPTSTKGVPESWRESPCL